MENNKVLNLLDKAIEILDRCWEGYKPVAGVKPYEAGSCEKKMATQSDMGEIEEVISMLDKAIKFYDPSQARDESGKWSGSGGDSGKIGDPSNDDPYLGGGIPELIVSAEKRLKSLKEKGEGYKAAVLEGQIDVLKSINERIKSKEKGLSINFYEPTQPRDERGRWDGGSGGLMISKEEASKITSQEKAYDAISSQLTDAKKSVEEIDDNAFIKIQQIGYKLRDMQGNSDQNYYSTIMATAREVANIADKLVNSGQKEARDSSVIFRGATEAMQEIAQAFRSNWNKK